MVVTAVMFAGGALSMPVTGFFGLALSAIGLVGFSFFASLEEPREEPFEEGQARRRRLAEGVNEDLRRQRRWNERNWGDK